MKANNKTIYFQNHSQARNITIQDNGEVLINIVSNNPRIIYQPYYFNRGILGATKNCYMRESVYHRLVKALEFLPKGYGFKIFDAWRPFEVQKFLYDEQVQKLLQNGSTSLEKAQIDAKQFVSFPSKSPLQPYVHATGGAIDLTIIDQNNIELNMGTNFDDFSNLSLTNSFENTSNTEVKNNRRLLYYAMTSAGFTNYPFEWWHYDYGDIFWALANNLTLSIFGGIYKI